MSSIIMRARATWEQEEFDRLSPIMKSLEDLKGLDHGCSDKVHFAH